jgi:hypothetical protein
MEAPQSAERTAASTGSSAAEWPTGVQTRMPGANAELIRRLPVGFSAADHRCLTRGDLEKSISVLIETGSAVNASESKREQSGIIRRHFRGIKRPRQFFEVP